MPIFFDKNKKDISQQLDGPTEVSNNPTCLGEPWCSAWEICSGTDNATALVEDEYDTEIIKQDTFYSNLTDNGPTVSQLPAHASTSLPNNKRPFAAQ